MSEAAADAGAGAPGGAGGEQKSGSKLSIDLIVVLLNTLALFGTVGMLYYTKMLFKRPSITEEAERARLALLHAKPLIPPTPGTVSFEQVTINILASPARPGVEGGDLQIKGRLHYATIAFSLELRDASRASEIEELRPRIMDSILTIMGHKSFGDLSSAQGRYLLRTQIVESINRLVAHYEHGSGESPESGREPARGDAAKAAGTESDELYDESYGMREGLVTNAFFTQFIVQ